MPLTGQRFELIPGVADRPGGGRDRRTSQCGEPGQTGTARGA